MRKLALFVLILFAISCAENYVVVNSMDGRDVLSGIFYANVKGYPVSFMGYPGSSEARLAVKVGEDRDILLIQSEKTPVSTFVRDALEINGNTIQLYNSVDGGETNLDLAVKSGAKKFIIVESAFSDGAFSAMPYAALSGSYVIFTNEENAGRVKEIVSDADEIIIYGYVDSAVKERLADLNSTIIGKGEDRYEDNTLMVGKTMEEYGIKSVIMTEGTFIEDGMINSRLPILFSGRVVPSVTYDFVKGKVKNDELNTVYLIGGTQITNAVRNMREQIKHELNAEGINQSFGIWLRFAQLVPGETGMVVLDTFPLPAYIPRLEITEVVYNTATENVMITIENIGDGPAFYQTEVHILVNGEEYLVLGDEEPSLLEYKDIAGAQYGLDLSEIEEGNITVVAIVKYGSSKNALEEYDDYIGGLVEIEYVDHSNVSAKEVRYDSSRKTLYLSVKNNKEEIAYVSPDVTVVMDGEPTTIKGPYNEPVEGNSIIVVDFPVELSDEDLAANEEVTAHLKYGGRPGFLTKESSVVLPLQREGMNVLLILLIALIVLLILLAAYLFWKNRKKSSK